MRVVSDPDPSVPSRRKSRLRTGAEILGIVASIVTILAVGIPLVIDSAMNGDRINGLGTSTATPATTTSANSESPGRGAEPPGSPEQPDPESCVMGNKAELDFEKEISGIDIPGTVDVKCSAPVGRTYVMVVERNFEGVPYYYPKREIDSNTGTQDGSITLEGSEPHSTRQIYVISIDKTELDALWDTGPDGELTRLPGSCQRVSAKYSHTRTS